ncbi:hypothetical protein HYDPIDRAFT_89999 [Hydnomerulius pinastri MD-312]|uniref:YTH domain-containing protein n=1 Tax=Hydnomerulius pinastri MD-312 TaxID=994086 RepID=A0A0C9W9V3_9AGAM|nr:hypothetical protein HYDPIDRAFT_89999 [Hydnomerulius pinastri MD-312]
MWAGNVPGDTTHDELWRFLKRPTSPKPGKEDVEGEDDGVTSIFLISRSNCAFVNFDSEEHLLRAISLFNGQQLRPQDRRCPRLVCRARRKEDDLRAGVGGQRGMGVHMQYIRKMRQRSNEQAEDEQPSSEDRSLVPALSSDEEMTKSQPWAGADLRSPKAKARSASSYASTNSSFLTQHFPKRFFILKSLTQFDLDLSVERGLWATQKHNEAILDQAFRTSKEVILIFGVNKSGEFFGYARMTGRILHGEHRISWASRADSSPSSLSSLSSAAGRRHSRGTPGEPESPLLSTGSRGSPLTYFTPSERRLVEVSPLPFSPPQGDNSGAKEVRIPPQERQSAPPAFGRPQRDFSAEPPAPKFSLNTKLYPDITLAAKESATIAPKEIVLDKTAPARAVRNNRGSLDDSKSAISSLHPVEEEKHNCSGGDDDDGAQSPTQSPTQAGEGREAGWGQTFKIEWICTERLPFYRTRHLRNVWNHDREIKVSRDGTELEPGVGQQLVEEWSTLAADAANGDESRSADSGKRAAKSTSALACYGESKGDEDEPS